MSYRYKIIIEYIGTNLVGWQRQANGFSVQQLIEDTIKIITKQCVVVFGSGRTDAGVHALGQVAHFDLENCYNIKSFLGSLNHFLKPYEIVVLSCELVNIEFHARFSAKMRHYKYKILNRPTPPMIDKNRVWWIKQPLNTQAIQSAIPYFIGKHDFTSFRALKCQSISPIKTLSKIELNIIDDNIILLKISAPSFLHHMVRNITGTLVEVGLNKYSSEHVKIILEAKDRTLAGPTAPACGLYFMRVDY